MTEAYSPQDNPYPRMLYREATGDAMLRSGDRDLDHRVVSDAEEETAALNEGWRTGIHPLDHDADGRPGGTRPVAPPPPPAPVASAELDAARAEVEELKRQLAAAEVKAAPAPTPTPAPPPSPPPAPTPTPTPAPSGDDPRVALRAEYRTKVGRNPFDGWSAEELRRRIHEHLAKAAAAT